ncbi:MAG: hypothetical protein EOO38_27795 [Cytophagaceae bacterium]|nr:MAG: hypothetical protein EOO38_27795 [Cytophagaceae bacterium]
MSKQTQLEGPSKTAAKASSAYQKDLVKFNIRETVRLLRRMDSPPDYVSFNEDDLCRTIGSCVADSNAVLFNGEALSDVDGLIRLTSFCERATSLGKKIDLDSLAKDIEVRRALDQKQTASTRDVRKLLEKELSEVSRFRNRIAHTGGNASDVTDSILRSHKALLAALATVIEKHT